MSVWPPANIGTSNVFRQSYFPSFVDISGQCILRSDVSMNSRLFVGAEVYQCGSIIRTPRIIASGSTVITVTGGTSTNVSLVTYSAPTGPYASGWPIAIVTNGDFGAQPNLFVTAVNVSLTQTNVYVTGAIAGAARFNYIIYAI